ncbi:DNA primase, partial [bacterium]|nr:DNA primase [bacterium]NIO18341.1 DNA primase [bacterium]
MIVKGESSAGKSYLVSSVSQFFPEEDILEFTALTPKALFHRKDNIKHKALIVYERSGAEESDYSIRTLQSEKKLIFSTPVKDPLTGNFETQDIEIEGPIAYIETTTRSHIHPEN